MARKIEMRWVCSSCRTENLGRHKRCEHCGDPKDASEPWVMPSDTRAAPTVTDPALLRHAHAGPDWQCGYCGSHQKRLDGACAQCGAAQADGARVPRGGATARVPPGTAPAFPLQPVRRRPGVASRIPRWLAIVAATLTALTCGVCGLTAALVDPPPPVLTKPAVERVALAGVRWTHVVHVERYRAIGGEGFVEDRPSDAFDVESLGQAHHHDEQVLDHYETEHYTEQVPYQDTETYTDREACGEDCTTEPETCHEVCSPDDNGFATCHDVCSGGGRSCTTRYCDVTRTRSVTRYRAEPRTRQVPRYRSEPRYAERFRWRVWRWGHHRDVERSGDGAHAPGWPHEAELSPPAPLGEGEHERTRREARYVALLTRESGARFERQLADLRAYQEIQDHEAYYLDPASQRLVKPVPTFATR